MLNKVPEVTIYFWIIKVLCTTVGETFADFLSGNVGLGEKGTALIMAGVLAVVLAVQFQRRKYVPAIYWLAVVLVSIVGTLITDNLTDNYGVTTSVTTPIFAAALAVTFAVWYGFERTLSIHTIFTTRREAFYWLAILFTFALGTAGGDLLSEKMSLGYWVAAAIFAGAIAVIAVGHFGFRVNAVLAFWLAYILTRPLGASIGDGLSQTDNQGLGLGTTVTSLIFLAVIAALVAYLTRTRLDGAPEASTAVPRGARVLVVTDRAAATPALLDAVRGRVARGPVGLHVLVPNPVPAEWHPTHPERHEKASEAEQVLSRALLLIREAAGARVEGSVSIRHDPMDAIEESLREGDFDEIILCTLPHGVSGWLHVDLPHRVAHLGVPVTTVTTEHRPRPTRRRAGRPRDLAAEA
jgi:uncharacterized membrane-anchored protein